MSNGNSIILKGILEAVVAEFLRDSIKFTNEFAKSSS